MSKPILPPPVVSRNQPPSTRNSITSVTPERQAQNTIEQPQSSNPETSIVEDTTRLDSGGPAAADQYHYNGIWDAPAGSYLDYVQTIERSSPALEKITNYRYRTPEKVDLMVLGIMEDGTCLTPKIFGESESISRYIDSNPLQPSIRNPSYTALRNSLEELKPLDVAGRLILVEDLSSAVIEALGSALDLSPFFFARHLADTNLRPSTRAPDLTKLDNYFSSSWNRSIEVSDKTPSNNLARYYSRKGGKYPPTVEERISFTYKRDDHGWTGILLFDPTEVSQLMPGNAMYPMYRSRSTQPILVPTFKEFAAAGARHMRKGWGDPSTRNNFVDYLTGIKEGTPSISGNQPCTCGISMSVGGSPSFPHQIFHFMLEDWRVVLEEAERFLDQVDTQMSDNTTLREMLDEWRLIFDNFREALSRAGKNIPLILGAGHNLGELKPDFETVLGHIESLKSHMEKSFGALMSSMSIIESQRAISQAESISRLTELAFFFIPLSFATSVFGMQIPGWSENYRAYMWPVVSVSLVCAAYAFRIAIRSKVARRLIPRVRQDLRTISNLPISAPIPTRYYLLLPHVYMGKIVDTLVLWHYKIRHMGYR